MGCKRRQNLPSPPEAHRYPIHHQKAHLLQTTGTLLSKWGLVCSSALDRASCTWKHPKYRCLPWPNAALYFSETQSPFGREPVYCFSLVSSPHDLGKEGLIAVHSSQFTSKPTLFPTHSICVLVSRDSSTSQFCDSGDGKALASPFTSQSSRFLICKRELTPASQGCCEVKQKRYPWQWLANGTVFVNISCCYYYHLVTPSHWHLQQFSITKQTQAQRSGPTQPMFPLPASIFFPPSSNHRFQPPIFSLILEHII